MLAEVIPTQFDGYSRHSTGLLAPPKPLTKMPICHSDRSISSAQYAFKLLLPANIRICRHCLDRRPIQHPPTQFGGNERAPAHHRTVQEQRSADHVYDDNQRSMVRNTTFDRGQSEGEGAPVARPCTQCYNLC